MTAVWHSFQRWILNPLPGGPARFRSLCSGLTPILHSTLGVSDALLEEPPGHGPLPGGDAAAEAAKPMVNATVNRVVVPIVFISCVVGFGGVPVGMVSRRTINTVFGKLYTGNRRNPWKSTQIKRASF